MFLARKAGINPAARLVATASSRFSVGVSLAGSGCHGEGPLRANAWLAGVCLPDAEAQEAGGVLPGDGFALGGR